MPALWSCGPPCSAFSPPSNCCMSRMRLGHLGSGCTALDWASACSGQLPSTTTKKVRRVLFQVHLCKDHVARQLDPWTNPVGAMPACIGQGSTQHAVVQNKGWSTSFLRHKLTSRHHFACNKNTTPSQGGAALN
eukprot:scaffold23989_cov19-Tisochrysis_lutea.AAC.1